MHFQDLKRPLLSLVWAVSFIFAAACSSVTLTDYSRTPNAKLENYKTFDFYEVQAESEIPTKYHDRIKLIQEETGKLMNSLGLTQSKENPDLLINLGLSVQEKVQTRETDLRTDPPNYIGQRNYKWESKTVETGRYDEGTVFMDWVDRAKSEQMWQFVLTGVMAKDDEAALKNIRKGAELITKKIQPD